jgi:hypothetical protein
VRLLFDTGVWSSLGDQGRGSDLRAWEQRPGHRILLSSAVLEEVLLLPKHQARDRIVAAMCSGLRDRIQLPPDARGEALEVVGEFRRCRPAWLRMFPRTDDVPNDRTTRQRWTQARDNPTMGARWAAKSAADPLREDLGDLQNDVHRKTVGIGDGPGFWVPSGLTVEVGENPPTSISEGWPGIGSLDAWRVCCAMTFWLEWFEIPGQGIRTRPLAFWGLRFVQTKGNQPI